MKSLPFSASSFLFGQVEANCGYFGHAKNTTPFMRGEDKSCTFGTFIANPLWFCRKDRKDDETMKESSFQHTLRQELLRRFEGSIVTKLDAGHIQGIPDLLILWRDRWAALECKKSNSASKRPNQEYYVEKMNEMSFARFISPENKEEVLDDLERAFRS